jgi:hypothetical protein
MQEHPKMGDRSFKVDLNWHTQSHDCYWSPTPQVSEGLFTTRGFDTLSFEKVMEEIMKLEYSGATASSQAHRLAAHPSVNARDLQVVLESRKIPARLPSEALEVRDCFNLRAIPFSRPKRKLRPGRRQSLSASSRQIRIGFCTDEMPQLQ